MASAPILTPYKRAEAYRIRHGGKPFPPAGSYPMALIATIAVISATSVGGLLWRVCRSVSPRDVLMVARATGSVRACVGYILFCTRP